VYCFTARELLSPGTEPLAPIGGKARGHGAQMILDLTRTALLRLPIGVDRWAL
jgi:hypothetical protein